MKVLKDIKISKDRIPVQNALWIRPMGGLSFKLYIPSGVDWKEVGIDNKPSPSPTPSGKKSNCEGGKVIVGKCIAKYPTVGDRYYFADGIVKFKKHRWENGQWSIMRYDALSKSYLETCESTPNNLNKCNRHFPIVVTITKAGLSCIENVSISKIWKETVHNGTVRTSIYCTGVDFLTCDTTSPFFKIVDGYLRHIRQYENTEKLVYFKQMKYTVRSDGRRGHDSRKLKSGWAFYLPKKRKASKTRRPSPGHSSSVRERQIVKITKNSLPQIAKSPYIGKSILIRRISKRRESNMFRGYYNSVSFGPKTNYLRISTKYKRL